MRWGEKNQERDISMRLDMCEKKALVYALKDFKGDAYLFGSRVDDTKKGGDIDLLLIPKEKDNPLKLSLQIQAKFFSLCEEKIDVVIYNNSSFCKEIIKHAKRLDIARIRKYLDRRGIFT